MNMRLGVVNRAAVSSLVLGRIVYAVNWYNMAAVFSLTASELNLNVSGLGLVTAMFYVGIGLFQMLGGILAAKIGPRLTATYGTIIASLAALLSGFASNLVEIAFLRFIVGLGMAFVFAPSVILMTRFLQEGSEGLSVGLYNSASSLGGVIGLSGWAILASVVGWRNSLVTSGSLGLLTAALLFLLIPKDSPRSGFRVDLPHLKGILLDKWLIALSVALLGIGVGNTVVGNFMAYYLENATHIGVGGSGTIASVASLFAFLAAPFSGKLLDRFGNVKLLVFASGVLMALGIGLAFFGTVYSAILCVVLVGSASGAGYTLCFSAARAAHNRDLECETLAVSWVNSISLFGNFAPSLLFSTLVTQYGYSPAWLFLAVLTFVLMVPVLSSKVSKRKGVSDH